MGQAMFANLVAMLAMVILPVTIEAMVRSWRTSSNHTKQPEISVLYWEP
jgi:hypothetical protein